MTSQVKRMYVKTMRGAPAVSRLAARVVTAFQAQLATTITVFALFQMANCVWGTGSAKTIAFLPFRAITQKETTFAAPGTWVLLIKTGL